MFKRDLPRSRTAREARLTGEAYYFTGAPCKHGHLAERNVKRQTCMHCERTGAKPFRPGATGVSLRDMVDLVEDFATDRKTVFHLIDAMSSWGMDVDQLAVRALWSEFGRRYAIRTSVSPQAGMSVLQDVAAGQ